MIEKIHPFWPYKKTNRRSKMTRQEMQDRMDAATKSCKEQGLIQNDCDKYSFSDYWANSASQSYCNKVKNGQVKVIKI